MPTPENVRLAVLIDADNTSASFAAAILQEVAKYGVPNGQARLRRLGEPHLNGWRAKLAEHAIQPIHQVAYTTGKNSTDSALIIGAMDLLYSGNLDAFAIVSSDSDFTSLAIRLRESGKTVYGFGQRKTPKVAGQRVQPVHLSSRCSATRTPRSPRRRPSPMARWTTSPHHSPSCATS